MIQDPSIDRRTIPHLVPWLVLPLAWRSLNPLSFRIHKRSPGFPHSGSKSGKVTSINLCGIFPEDLVSLPSVAWTKPRLPLDVSTRILAYFAVSLMVLVSEHHCLHQSRLVPFMRSEIFFDSVTPLMGFPVPMSVLFLRPIKEYLCFLPFFPLVRI